MVSFAYDVNLPAAAAVAPRTGADRAAGSLRRDRGHARPRRTSAPRSATSTSTRPLSDAQIAQLQAAFTQYQRPLLPRPAHLVRRSDPFGETTSARSAKHVGKTTISKPTDNPLVRKFHYDEHSKLISGENFHSDQSCAPIPPLGTMLYNHTVPPDGGGDTQFASMYAAYDALSPRMKAYLEGLTATHDGDARVRARHAGVGPSGRRPPSRERPQGALRQHRLHRAHQRSAAARSRPAPAVPRRSLRQPAVDRAASAGTRTRSRSGTTAASSIKRSGITGRTCARATACRSKERSPPLQAKLAARSRRRAVRARARALRPRRRRRRSRTRSTRSRR